MNNVNITSFVPPLLVLLRASSRDLNGTIASLTCCYCYKWNPKLDVSDKECKNEDCKKVFPRDPAGAKNNTIECAQQKVELAEAAEIERQLAERAAAEEEAERERAVLAIAERASRRERERAISARAERARKRAQEAHRGTRSLRQRIR